MTVLVQAVSKPEVPPFTISDRFKHEITYFMALPGEPDVPATIPLGEYWVRQADVRTWLDDGVFRLVSPLDSENKTEIELSEEHEAWLEWMLAHGVEHIRLV